MTKKLKFKSIGVKMTTILVALAITSVTGLGLIVVRTANNAIESQVFNQLNAVGKLKSNQVFSFLERKFSDLKILSEDMSTAVAVNDLSAYFETEGSNVETEQYKRIYNEIDPFYKSLKTNLDVHDLFIISAKEGNVMYTVNRGKDLGANLKRGQFADSGLAKLWKAISTQRIEKYMVDLSYYEPANDNVAFLGVPVFTDDNEIIAVFALMLCSDEIGEIMNESTGMGESGESYLVGEDFLMRSDSKFFENSTTLKQKVETESVHRAFNHESGYHIIEDYRGVKVLSYYSYIEFEDFFNADFDWAIISEMDKEEAFASENELIRKIIWYGILTVAIVILFSVMIAKFFTKPIKELAKITKLLAEGDLTQEIGIESNDEIGDLAMSFKIMRQKFRSQIDEMKDGVNVLASSSSEIMAMISQLASGSAETATSVSETTTTIEEVKQTAEVSVQKATEVSETAQKISSISLEGKRSVDETIEGMKRIKDQMESIAAIVIQLSEKGNTIGEIANNVNDLAEQSNLLAVNASIEAAKAGEHGKGFSVVAQEIKNLASRSKDSTVQIRSILNDIQKEITNAVMATEQGGKVIDAGLELSATAKGVISMLASGVEQTSEANIHIAASSQEQLTGMDQINMAMENIKEASQHATEGTVQAEESIGELKELGEKLLRILKQFKLD